MPTVFPVLLDSTLFELGALVGFLVTMSSHDSENMISILWILYLLLYSEDIFLLCSLPSSHIPSIPLFPPHVFVNYG